MVPSFSFGGPWTRERRRRLGEKRTPLGVIRSRYLCLGLRNRVLAVDRTVLVDLRALQPFAETSAGVRAMYFAAIAE